MTPAFRSEFDLTSPEATTRLAAALAPLLGAGDTILLGGQIGAGKTHFARALIQARLASDGLAPEDVPSPTFTLVQTYALDGLELWHADLYRLTHPDEVEELGLTEAFETAICLVEWPDRLGELAPPGALSLELAATGDETRHVIAASDDPAWAPRLAALAPEPHGA